jgi:hypothetical protein
LLLRRRLLSKCDPTGELAADEKMTTERHRYVEESALHCETKIRAPKSSDRGPDGFSTLDGLRSVTCNDATQTCPSNCLGEVGRRIDEARNKRIDRVGGAHAFDRLVHHSGASEAWAATLNTIIWIDRQRSTWPNSSNRLRRHWLAHARSSRGGWNSTSAASLSARRVPGALLRSPVFAA